MLARAGIFLLWLLHYLPFRVLVWFGNSLGSILYHLAAERRKVGAVNLKLCFPDMSEEARTKLLREHFRMFARYTIHHTDRLDA